ncbi:MAG: pyridoxal phosphate-dependent aminotransferase [Candidatus Heimdallarchaeota archaeon]|nr:pyridoxal phosphate-dependent aminotransferase [Candidatus Heimdallarchaeota archaeon]MCK4769751.1 pyridoxal phosphate-dependent aminotransferase [Candidatus Heimdallarchaeota archaeon]
MKYDFDRVIDRTNTHSVKWDKHVLKEFFGTEDVLPAWVADMDFQCPEPVIDAVKKKAAEQIYGYSWHGTPEFYGSILGWMKRRHNCDVEKDWIVFSPGVMPAVNVMIRTFTNPGDKIIVQSPVYYPFFSAVQNNGRQMLNNQLKYENKKYTFDFESFEEQAKDPRTKMFVLCSPHNPVGRVWTEAELKKLGDICLENDVLVVSDEIHHDLILSGYKHTVFSNLGEEYMDRSIVCSAPSKSFNMAGLQISNVVISNKKMREEFQHSIVGKNSLMIPNAFGIVALMAAYSEGDEWLNQVMEYIEDNFRFVKNFLEDKLPDIDMVKPEGTYLAWLDFSSLGMNDEDRKEFLLRKAKVALDNGAMFGSGGEGFERLNVACPRTILEEIMNWIYRAIKAEAS